jgi:hypothetical protein
MQAARSSELRRQQPIMLIFVFKYLLCDEGLGFRRGAVDALGFWHVF